MEIKDLRDLVRFDLEPVRAEVLETANLWSEVVCLDRNQQLGPMGDPGSDALCVVAAGKVVVQVDRSRKRLEQWGVAVVPVGGRLTLTNASDDPAVVLIVTAPPPAPGEPGD